MKCLILLLVAIISVNADNFCSCNGYQGDDSPDCCGANVVYKSNFVNEYKCCGYLQCCESITVKFIATIIVLIMISSVCTFWCCCDCCCCKSVTQYSVLNIQQNSNVSLIQSGGTVV